MTRNVTLRLDDETLDRARLLALASRKSLTEVMREALEEHVRNHAEELRTSLLSAADGISMELANGSKGKSGPRARSSGEAKKGQPDIGLS